MDSWRKGPRWKRFSIRIVVLLSLGIAPVLLVFLSGAMASFNANASNPDDRSGGQVRRQAPPGTVWIPAEGTFLMGTNDKESFPNDDPPTSFRSGVFGWMNTM